MPTYEFECRKCNTVTEGVFSFASKPSSVTCPCGGVAHSIISRENANAFVKDRPYVFDRGLNVQNFGKRYGRSDQQQHAMHQRHIAEMHQMHRKAKAAKMQGAEYLGTMPGEMVDSIGLHEGDREAVAKDPVKFLKKTDLYRGS